MILSSFLVRPENMWAAKIQRDHFWRQICDWLVALCVKEELGEKRQWFCWMDSGAERPADKRVNYSWWRFVSVRRIGISQICFRPRWQKVVQPQTSQLQLGDHRCHLTGVCRKHLLVKLNILVLLWPRQWQFGLFIRSSDRREQRKSLLHILGLPCMWRLPSSTPAFDLFSWTGGLRRNSLGELFAISTCTRSLKDADRKSRACWTGSNDGCCA